MLRPRRVIAAAVGGAALCTFGDHLHATHGVLSYPRVYLASQAWWGPLLFFGAAIAVLALAVGSRRALRGSPVDAAWPRIAGDALAFVTAYAFTAFAAELPDVVLAVLVGWWIARMLSSRAQPWVVALGLGLAVLGPLFEDRWASLGMFAYCRPDLAGVPRWLPALYLHVAPLAARLEARVSA